MPLTHPKLSDTMLSNLFTMSAAAKADERQRLPIAPGVPSPTVRELRARLILEEALETIAALGFHVRLDVGVEAHNIDMACIRFQGGPAPDLLEIIDGCIDTEYVTKGTLAACGVPDVPHAAIVNLANNAKFPGGVAIVSNGKYQKPAGWKGPDHAALLAEPQLNLREIGQRLLDSFAYRD